MGKYEGMTREAMQSAYDRKHHAIQSGVAFEFGRNCPTIPEEILRELKYLRTGLNLVMRDHASLGGLLIAKGVFTPDEYQAAILEGLDEEVRGLEARLRAMFGANVTLH